MRRPISGFSATRPCACSPSCRPQQGVVNWPSSGHSASALVETTDDAAARLLDRPRDPDPWARNHRTSARSARRNLAHPDAGRPGPDRRAEPRAAFGRASTATPFGHGQPFSRGQLRELMRETLFSPTHWAEALYVPPFRSRTLLRTGMLLRADRRLFRLARRRRPDRRGDQAALSSCRRRARARGAAAIRAGCAEPVGVAPVRSVPQQGTI